jgi:hypothetical protein
MMHRSDLIIALTSSAKTWRWFATNYPDLAGASLERLNAAIDALEEHDAVSTEAELSRLREAGAL